MRYFFIVVRVWIKVVDLELEIKVKKRVFRKGININSKLGIFIDIMNKNVLLKVILN